MKIFSSCSLENRVNVALCDASERRVAEGRAAAVSLSFEHNIELIKVTKGSYRQSSFSTKWFLLRPPGKAASWRHVDRARTLDQVRRVSLAAMLNTSPRPRHDFALFEREREAIRTSFIGHINFFPGKVTHVK